MAIGQVLKTCQQQSVCTVLWGTGMLGIGRT